MKKITWYLNRLKAMNMGEICWRFQLNSTAEPAPEQGTKQAEK